MDETEIRKRIKRILLDWRTLDIPSGDALLKIEKMILEKQKKPVKKDCSGCSEHFYKYYGCRKCQNPNRNKCRRPVKKAKRG